MNIENKGNRTAPSGRSDFTENMFYLLTQGGMMQISCAHLFDKKLYLLSPPTKTYPYFCFNYFDDTFHDKAIFYPTEEKLSSGALGDGNFARVMCAANRFQMLREHSSTGATTVDMPVTSPNVDGWLNYLFESNAVSSNPWKPYQSAPSSVWKEALVKAVWRRTDTQQFILNDCFGPFVSQDEQLMAAEYNSPFPQFMPVAVLRNAEEAIYCIRLSGGTQNEKYKFMREVLSGNRNDASGMPPCYQMFIVARDTLPVEILLPMIAKEFELDDKSLHKEFDPSSFCSPAFSLYQSQPQNQIVPTSEFLHISDDDRAYYWTHGGDISFSSEMKAWLSSLKKEYRNMMDSGENILPILKFTLLLFSTLEDINNKFREIYAFKDMFADYLQHMESREYQIAWFILCRLAQYQESDFIRYDCPWEQTPPEFRYHPARLAIKRYLAVLANRELRREVFGF